MNDFGIRGAWERKERERLIPGQEIGDGANKVFDWKGFKRATVEEMAKECESSPGPLYLHVRNNAGFLGSANLGFTDFDFVQAKAHRVIANDGEHLIRDQGLGLLPIAVHVDT